jgi:general secretion pathway protein K
LWTLVLLALIVTHIIASGRGEARIAANLRANAAAEALADGAIYEGIFRLVDTSGAHWEADGAVHRLSFKDAVVTARIMPLEGKVNPNIASVQLLTALLEVTGTAAGNADILARAIADWRGRDHRESPLAQRLVPYRMAGLDYGPPGAPFESLDEIAQVLGMSPAVLSAMKPHLSLYQSGAPNPRLADPTVAQALRHVPASVSSSLSADPSGPAPGQIQTVSIEAGVATVEGARFTRHAVVRVGPVFPRGYLVLAWGGDQDEE